MRFLKRLIFVIILLLLAFFIYRLINPKAAQSLLFDLKKFSNTTVWTHFSLTGDVVVTTWVILDMTGSIESWAVESWTIQDTWALQELTSTDELLLKDTSFSPETSGVIVTTWMSYSSGTTWLSISSGRCPAMPTVDSCPSGQEKYVVYRSSLCWTYYSCRTLPSSSHGLSTQDKRKTENILQWFGN